MKFIRLIAALAVTLFIAIGVAQPASAWTVSYLHKVTKPSRGDTACGGLGVTTANLEVEAYNIKQSDGTIARVYNIDMDGDERSGDFDVNNYRLYIDGVRQPSTQAITVKFQDQDKRRDIRGEWLMGICIWYGTLWDM